MSQQSFLSRTAAVLLLLVVSACLLSTFAWETSASAVLRRHGFLQRRIDDYTEPSSDELAGDFVVEEIDTSATPGSAIPQTASSINSDDQTFDYGDEVVNSGDEIVDPDDEVADSGDEMVGIETIPSTTVTSTTTITAPIPTVLISFTTVPALSSSAPPTTPIEGGSVESATGATADSSHVPVAMEELTPGQRTAVEDFTAAMCAEVTCDYKPSEECSDAQDDPCIAVEDALKSPTFLEAYEEAKKKVAAEEEERKKKDNEEGGNEGKDGDDRNDNGGNNNDHGGDDGGNDDDDDDGDDLGLKVGLPVGLGVPTAGALGASAYGKFAGKAWWPPGLFKPKAKEDGAPAPNPEPNPEPTPGPGTPPTPGTPEPPVGPPPNVEPPINYTPVNNVDGETDKDPEQEEEGAWKQSPSSPHRTLRQSLSRRGSGVDSTPSSLPAPGFSPFRRSVPRSLRPLFADHRRRVGLADCQGELMRKNQELDALKYKLDELEKYNPQEGASDYRKVQEALREWQNTAQDPILEQDQIKQDLKRCQDAVEKIEFDEPDSDGKGKEPETKCEAQENQKIEDLEQKVKQIEDLERKVKQIEDLERKVKQMEDLERKVKQTEDLERKVKSLESAYQGAQQAADELRARESQVAQDLTKCSKQKEKCKREKKKLECPYFCFW